MYPSNVETDFDMRLTPTYTIEFDSMEPSYPFVIWLTLESSSFVKSQVSSLKCGCGFIHTWAVPCGRGHAQGGGSNEALGGVGNDFVPC